MEQEKVVSGTKTWDDNFNQDGKRPDISQGEPPLVVTKAGKDCERWQQLDIYILQTYQVSVSMYYDTQLQRGSCR